MVDYCTIAILYVTLTFNLQCCLIEEGKEMLEGRNSAFDVSDPLSKVNIRVILLFRRKSIKKRITDMVKVIVTLTHFINRLKKWSMKL